MAVTIDDLQIEVQEPAPAASPAAPGEKQKKNADLRAAMEMIQERNLRLRAD